MPVFSPLRFVAVTACCAATPAADQTLVIHSNRKFPLSPLLHSIFFETEINFGSEGGLYAEMLFNRDFETQGRGTMPPPSVGTAANQSQGFGSRFSLPSGSLMLTSKKDGFAIRHCNYQLHSCNASSMDPCGGGKEPDFVFNAVP
jgi:hypothetical protein